MQLKPRILAILPGFIPSTVTLVVKPLLALHQAGQIMADITLETVATRSQVARANLIVFARNVEPAHSHLLEAARQLKRPIIYDLDDNFFDIPLTDDVGRYHRNPRRLRQLEAYLVSANLVRVYSQPLQDRVALLNPHIEKITPPVDWSLIPATLPVRRGGTAIKIVYATSRIQDNLAHIFLEDLLRVAERYPGKVELHFWGYRPPQLKKHPMAHFVELIPNYDQYLRKFYEHGYDIGLAPLLNDIFHLSKTNTKFRDYGACRVAGIYSDVEVYRECVENGVTGLLVPNRAGAWYEALVRLIEDQRLREDIQEQAQRYVRDNYSQEKFQQLWWAHIQRVLIEARQSTAARDLSEGRLHDILTEHDAREQKRPLLLRLLHVGHTLASLMLTHRVVLRWYLYNFWTWLKVRYITSPIADYLRRGGRAKK